MDAHLRDLRYFVAVAEELNFTRAAERLHISQPALSKQIQGLENSLRAQLFARDRRQVSLTAAGRALLDVARPLLDRWDEGMAAVAEAVATEARKLRVGTLTSIGRGLYPSVVDHFGQTRTRLPFSPLSTHAPTQRTLSGAAASIRPIFQRAIDIAPRKAGARNLEPAFATLYFRRAPLVSTVLRTSIHSQKS